MKAHQTLTEIMMIIVRETEKFQNDLFTTTGGGLAFILSRIPPFTALLSNFHPAVRTTRTFIGNFKIILSQEMKASPEGARRQRRCPMTSRCEFFTSIYRCSHISAYVLCATANKSESKLFSSVCRKIKLKLLQPFFWRFRPAMMESRATKCGGEKRTQTVNLSVRHWWAWITDVEDHRKIALIYAHGKGIEKLVLTSKAELWESHLKADEAMVVSLMIISVRVNIVN